MTRETRTRAGIAVLIYSMASGVLFGAGLIIVLTLPALNADTGFWISVVVGASFIFGNSHRVVDGPSTACPLLAAEGNRTCDDVRTALNPSMNERVTKQIFGRALSSVLLTMVVLNAIAG